MLAQSLGFVTNSKGLFLKCKTHTIAGFYWFGILDSVNICKDCFKNPKVFLIVVVNYVVCRKIRSNYGFRNQFR